MAKKKVLCPHEPHTHVYHRSKSSKFICCKACYMAELRKVIVETLGEEVAFRLDRIKEIKFDNL